MGGFANDEIPLLVMLFYLFRDVESSRFTAPGSSFKPPSRPAIYAGDKEKRRKARKKSNKA